jgi:G3E family GTPase
VLHQFAVSGIGTENELREDAQHAACRAQIIETSSGCLCCSAGGKDFKRVLAQLVDHRDKFDHVIIETTGLADPAFAATFFKPKCVRVRLCVCGVVRAVCALITCVCWVPFVWVRRKGCERITESMR